MIPLTAPLFVPATRPDRFAKAAASGADAVIIDLEDAVAPAQKEVARAHLGQASALPVPVIVRINAEGTPWHQSDLDHVRRLGLRLVCVPKTESAQALDRLATILGQAVELLALIETAQGVENAGAIAAHSAVRQLAFGPADFFLDMDMPPSRDMTDHVLRRLALASRAAGKAKPLDGPQFDLAHPDRLEEECRLARRSGAGGKLCIHPAQPAKVLEFFGSEPDEVAWAQSVLASGGDGSAQAIDGRMIDAPLLARARAIVARAGAAAALPNGLGTQNREPGGA